jgi:hypothetical protein
MSVCKYIKALINIGRAMIWLIVGRLFGSLVFWFIADLKSYDYDQLINKPSYFELIVIQQL